MGDISRHRDIYLNTREAIPTDLLKQCKLGVQDLTYLEMGNYLTDVSQFRDPVTYIFSKQRIWRDFILPKTADKVRALRQLGMLGGVAGLGAARVVQELTSGLASGIAKYTGPALAGVGAVLAALPTEQYADIGGADEWIDAMFGTPLERTPGDPRKREQKHYGFVGQFFRYFIEGITQLLFADSVLNKVKGQWGKLDRIPESSVTAVFDEFFTQYYPHEHTDQPPYTWDASARPKDTDMYGPSTRQRTLVDPDIGVMNAVDKHYIQYLSEGLADVEHDWRALKPEDTGGRHRLLVRMGKLLHGVEDWYFHSNAVELLRMRGHRPAKGAAEDGEAFLQRFVREVAAKDAEFTRADRTERLRLQRRLYRRLRYPAYERGNKVQSGGILSKTRKSTLSLTFAYPAFPSQQDTAHTLLHALENLEQKAEHPSHSGGFDIPPWAPCVFQKLIAARGEGQKLLEEKAKARNTTLADVVAALLLPAGTYREKIAAVVVDVLREWLPLVVTLLNESERQRLVANVDPLQWPVSGGAGAAKPPEGTPEDIELTKQLKRHKEALKRRKNDDGVTENNYERAIRYLFECGFLNAAGSEALKTAIEFDRKSQQLLEGAPGCGGFLMQFSLELQRVLDEGDAATAELNKNDRSMFDQASDNGAFNEIVGSHSLMSKDTLRSPPFFDEARVLASVASSSVFHIMLQQVSTPGGGRRMPWQAILHHFIRYPPSSGGWERQAMDLFHKNNGRIPRFADLSELARVVEAALRSQEALVAWQRGKKDEEMKLRYVKLEGDLSKYRYP